MVRIKKSLLVVLALICGITIYTSVPAFAQNGEDMSISTVSESYISPLEDIPELTLPSKEKWKHTRTKLFVVSQGESFHMVHDIITASDSNISMVGKFDYGKVFHKDLEDEKIHVYIYGTGLDNWTDLGDFWTNSDGKISVNIPASLVTFGEYMVKMVVAGDLTQCYGFLTIVNPEKKCVVFDIDGTLTTRDFEQVEDYLGIDNADAWAFGSETVGLYHERGYQVIYLTGRPYWCCKYTRRWLRNNAFPETILHLTLSNSDSMPGDPTEEYKTQYLQYLINEVGLDIVAAYGNASTDIAAYNNVGIPKSSTFIIGENAGDEGTVPLYNSYYDHYLDLQISLPVISE